MVTIDIRPSQLTSGYDDQVFSSAYDALTEEGFRIISLAENARLRVQQGQESDVSQNGNWVLEDAIYVPGKGNFLTKNSPINSNPMEATEAHINGHEFYPTERQIESALANSLNLPEANIEIPTDRFGEEELTVFAFGGEKDAKVYGEFLHNLEFNSMLVQVPEKDYVSTHTKPFARKIWFNGLNRMPSLAGCRFFNGGYDRVRGVLG